MASRSRVDPAASSPADGPDGASSPHAFNGGGSTSTCAFCAASGVAIANATATAKSFRFTARLSPRSAPNCSSTSLEAAAYPQKHVGRLLRARHRLRCVHADYSEVETESDVGSERSKAREALPRVLE